MRKRKLRGVVLYDGPSMLNGAPIVAIATFESVNAKTGNMIQVWILHRDDHPVEELQHDDSSICGNCPLRGAVCYVTVAQAPSQVWRAFQAGIYPSYDGGEHDSLFHGRTIRWGAYGDPAAMPLRIVNAINRRVAGWTGYTHQWQKTGRRTARLARLFMLSVETVADLEWCHSHGYRAFLVGDDAPDSAVECPAYTHGVQCADCLLCCGTERQAKHVYARPHGAQAGNLADVVQGA